MKKLLIIGLIVVMTFASVSGCAQPAPTPAPAPGPAPKTHEPVELEIWSAKFGGLHYLAGTALAEMLTDIHPWLRATNLEGESISNVKREEKKEKRLATSTSTVIWLATSGTPPFDKKYNPKAVFTYSVSIWGFFASAEPVKGPQDLVGKKIMVGPKASALLAESQFVLRDCMGIWDQIEPQYMDFGQGKDAFVDGLIDAIYTPGSYGGPGRYKIFPMMEEVFRLKECHLIGVTQEELERGKKATGWPVSSLVVPPGAFGPNLPAQEMLVSSQGNIFWAYPEVDEEIVYEVVKTAHENIKKFGDAHVAFKALRPEIMAWLPAASDAEVHPGALKYYKEQGIKVSLGGASPLK